jgi:biotin carboxyl carrier protein
VNAEDELLILEAMKMENPIYAPEAGKVAAVKVAVGDAVEANDVLIVLE